MITHDVAGYQLRVNGGSLTNYVKDIGFVSPGQHTLDASDGIEPDTPYDIEYRAYDRFSNFSAWSNPFNISTPPIPTIPSDISYLANWHRAKDIVGLSDNDPVDTFADSEGVADASSSGTSRPVYKANSGQPYVEFDGSNDYLDAATGIVTIPTDGDFSICLALEVVSVPADYSRILQIGGANGLILFSIGGNIYWYINGSGLNRAMASGFAAIYLERSGTTWKWRINGSQATATEGVSGFANSIVYGANPSHTENGNIRLKEFCLFSDKLTPTHFTVIETYWNTEHGLTL